MRTKSTTRATGITRSNYRQHVGRIYCDICDGSGEVTYYGQLQGSLEFGHTKRECGKCQGVGSHA